MSGKVMWLAACLWLLAPLLTAQPQEKKAPAPDEQERQLFQEEQRLIQAYVLQQAEHQAALAQAESPQFRMNEDVEVLRRILDGTIRRLSGRSLSGSGKAQGDGTFEDVTEKVGISKGVAMGDFDIDGNLDLFIACGRAALLDYDKAVPLYRNQGDGTFERVRIAAPAEAHGIFNIEAVEGTYLKGYGVVYSVSLPVVYQESVKESAKPAPKPLSQWERVRKELRGEKIEGEAKASPSREETLADAILKILADNGHHFSDLAENERISVALTLRASFWDQNCAKCHAQQVGLGVADHWKRSNMSKMMGTPGMPMGSMGGAMNMNKEKMPKFELRGAGGQASKPSRSKAEIAELVLPEVQKLQEEAQNQALLGDLHLKQERYKDAVAAYHKAVDAYQKAVDTKRLKEEDLRLQGILPAPDTKSDLKAAELYLKLGQSYLAAGQEAELRQTLQKVRELAQDLEKKAQAAQGRGKASGATSKDGSAAEVLLPSKLIISAPKKLMDQVAAGKISLDDFKKAASVEYVSFSHAKQKCAPNAGEPSKPGSSGGKGPAGKPH